MSLPPRLLSGTAVSAAGRIAATAISVLAIGVVSRGLATTGGVAAYGSYAAIFAFLAMLAVVADGGLYLVFARAAAQVGAAAESSLLAQVARIRLLAFLVAVFGVFVVATVLPYPHVVSGGILLGSLGILNQLTSQLTLGVYQKRLRMAIPAVAEIAGRFATLLIALWAAAASRGTLAYVAAFVGGTSVTALWNLVGARRLLRTRTSAAEEPSPLRGRELLKAAWPLGLMLVLWQVVFRADSVLLSVLRPPEDLGWYALPYKILESLLFFPAMVGGLLFPILSRTAARVEEPEQFRGTLTAATTLFLLLILPTVTLLFIGAPWVVLYLGGPAYVPSVPVLRILALALGALCFGNLYGNSAIALGAQRSLLRVAASLATLNILVNLLVIPRYSFLGAAWTTLGTEVLSAVLAGRIVWRRGSPFWGAREQWHVLSAGGALVLPLLLPLPLLLRACLGFAGYVAMLWALGVMTPAKIAALLRAQRLGVARMRGEEP